MWFAAPLMVLLVAGAIYGSIYFREESLATGIGANLVPAERVLKGEVPYRDFYKIQTPGILLLNAGLFKLFGTSLLTAFRGVLVFKVLAIVMVFLVARLVVSQTAAVVPTLLSIVWLPPGGPFRPAPIQYEMLFILGAVFFTLRWIDSRRALDAFAAGLAVGIVAVFKQNVGVYLAIALVLSLVLNSRSSFARGKKRLIDWRKRALYERPSAAAPSQSAKPKSAERGGHEGPPLHVSYIAAVLGIALPLLGLLFYLISNNALGAAVRVFINGPGEHIQMKLTGYPLPKHALILLIAGVGALKIADAVGRRFSRSNLTIQFALVVGVAVCAALVPQSFIDNSIFWFPPALFLYAAWLYFRAGRQPNDERFIDARRRAFLLALLLFSVGSYLEVFPRSVRGLVIGTLPPALILLAFVLSHNFSIAQVRDRKLAAFAAAMIAIFALVFGLRLIAPRYVSFEPSHVAFKADTELGFDRGRGVYLPARRAEEVNATVDLIRARVEQGGFFFAHAVNATPYYFLADRNSPTGATLWNDAGTNDAERSRTIEMLRQKQVKLVLTSEQALAGERYEPLVEYLKSEFRQTATIGPMVVLEKNNN
jgi:hypothetical protein